MRQRGLCPSKWPNRGSNKTHKNCFDIERYWYILFYNKMKIHNEQHEFALKSIWPDLLIMIFQLSIPDEQQVFPQINLSPVHL